MPDGLSWTLGAVAVVAIVVMGLLACSGQSMDDGDLDLWKIAAEVRAARARRRALAGGRHRAGN